MKKLLYRFLTGVMVTCAATAAFAQDVHFSQYNQAPILLNPALSGLNGCDYRAAANFRVQWLTVSTGNTYRTAAGSFDMAIGKVTKFNSFAGFGVAFYSDQAGDINFNTNRALVSLAYHFVLDRKGTQQISAGLHGAFNHRGINPSKATFDSQYDPTTGQVDPNGIKETFGRNRIFFGDAGLGVLYSALIGPNSRKSNVFFGVSLDHINQPKISFYPNQTDNSNTGNERLYLKTQIHGGASIPVSKRLAIQPNFLVMIQGPSYEFNVGCNFKAQLGNINYSKTALVLGAQYRGLLDAMVIQARVDVKGFSIGASYDINLSKLTPASQTIGGPEASLMYQGCLSKKPRPGICPSM
jgi:type IX secretion system PorP/SprF family membrane protein